MLRFYVCLVSFFHPLPDWILTIWFVFTLVWFHFFTRSKIEFLLYASFLRSLGFISSPAPRLIFTIRFVITFALSHSFTRLRLSFYHTLRFYVSLVSFFYPFPDWIFIIWLGFILLIPSAWKNAVIILISALILITIVKPKRKKEDRWIKILPNCFSLQKWKIVINY